MTAEYVLKQSYFKAHTDVRTYWSGMAENLCVAYFKAKRDRFQARYDLYFASILDPHVLHVDKSLEQFSHVFLCPHGLNTILLSFLLHMLHINWLLSCLFISNSFSGSKFSISDGVFIAACFAAADGWLFMGDRTLKSFSNRMFVNSSADACLRPVIWT